MISNFFKKKPKEPSVLKNQPVTLMAKLLFEEAVTPDYEKLSLELKKHFARFDEDGKSQHARQYFLRDYVVEYAEGILPAQCVLFTPESPASILTQLEKAFQQSWHWQDAQPQTAHCKYEIVVSELLSLPLPYKKRAECFQKFLYATCQVLKPKAVYFIQSDKLVETSAYCNHLNEQGKESLYALLNVRLFNLPDSHFYMDSLGLYALGLPDLQIKFKAYEPNNVAPVLYSLANYLYEKGSVILHGNTVEGVEQGSAWECQYYKAGVKPDRNVLHVFPVEKP